MIKILHVVPTLGYGGVAKVVCNYNQVIDHSKFKFDFVTHGEKEDYHENLMKEGSEIFYFKTMGSLGIRKYQQQIYDNIDLEKYDIIHIHTGHLTGFYAMIFKKSGAKKVVCHAHTTKCINKKHKWLMFLWRLLVNNYSDYNIACGQEAGKFCFGEKKFTILTNGILYNEMKNISEEKILKIKKEFNILNKDFIVGHVGMFDYPKNHDFICKIIHNFLRNNNNTKFILIGDGILKNKIKEKIKLNGDSKEVIFTGIRNDVYSFMKIFDAFILPSHHEGLPVVAIEAQAAGVRCVISENIDHTLDIKAGLVEFCSIMNGPDEWVNKLEKIKKNSKSVTPEYLERKMYESGYEISTSVKILMEIYEELIGDKIC